MTKRRPTAKQRTNLEIAPWKIDYILEGTVQYELLSDPKLIIASYLTRGLDVQSTLAAHQALRKARAGGSGILLISEDLDELFELSDRLIVLFEGKIVGKFTPEETNAIAVGHLMTGS